MEEAALEMEIDMDTIEVSKTNKRLDYKECDGDRYSNQCKPNNRETGEQYTPQFLTSQFVWRGGGRIPIRVFRWLDGNSSHILELMAQYLQLIAHPNDPRSGDYGYSKENMQSFGSTESSSVYKSIEDVVDRDHSRVYPDYTKEPDDLASGRANLQKVTLLSSNWFGSGVVHAKVWISDSRDVYIRSANNDWKYLTQFE
ncbi:Phospholipase D/Transphosphatidylase [Cynara cardunculus var. scolymus]|uniref:Phospholipase D/Transphosphatidylase n=1 Tax=Cynara cardunculus var. scolymus TaxID=59895 RepID=A0A103XDR6_CYNCS|nr:Phospholipase D/Transphosphatidylase [Cynara cardunculus var. scolymus]